MYAITTPFVTSAITHKMCLYWFLAVIRRVFQNRRAENCKQIPRNCDSGKSLSVGHVALRFDKGWLFCVTKTGSGRPHISASTSSCRTAEASRRTHLVALPASVWRSLYCVFGLLKPFRITLSYTWKTRRRRVSTSNPVFECGTVCSEMLKIIACCALIMVFKGRGRVEVATLQRMLHTAGGDSPICTVRRRA